MWAALSFGTSPIGWLRAAGLALIAALSLVTLVEESPSGVWAHYPAWVTGAFAAYAWVFVRNTAAFPLREPRQIWLLLAQLLLSVPFESNLTVVTAATIPLVIERERWRKWLAMTLGAVALVYGVRIGWGMWANWTKLPAGTSWGTAAVPVAAGLLEIAAWHVFAYLAAVLIVQFDEDRRRLAQVNAELRGAQVLLLESGRLAERLRISRELHDSLGHHLTSLSLQLEVAEHSPDDQLRPPLKQARFITKLLLADIREALSEWRTETSTALPDALRALTNALPGGELILPGNALPATSPTITHALFRCAQEAVTNALKHGAPRKVTVKLDEADGVLILTVADDGRGVAEVRPGSGLAGMRARAAEIGGTVDYSTAPGQGFRLTVRVPLP